MLIQNDNRSKECTNAHFSITVGPIVSLTTLARLGDITEELHVV